jgi:hypothetical protein
VFLALESLVGEVETPRPQRLEAVGHQLRVGDHLRQLVAVDAEEERLARLVRRLGRHRLGVGEEAVAVPPDRRAAGDLGREQVGAAEEGVHRVEAAEVMPGEGGAATVVGQALGDLGHQVVGDEVEEASAPPTSGQASAPPRRESFAMSVAWCSRSTAAVSKASVAS